MVGKLLVTVIKCIIKYRMQQNFVHASAHMVDIEKSYRTRLLWQESSGISICMYEMYFVYRIYADTINLMPILMRMDPNLFPLHSVIVPIVIVIMKQNGNLSMPVIL